MFSEEPQKIIELRALIIEACNEMTEDICRRVIRNVTDHVEEAARRNGGHIEHSIHKGLISMQWSSVCVLVSSIVIEMQILLII
jgi:hypothetical protein